MSAKQPKPGDLLGGKYRVERVLGTGGMGVVVAAKHVDLGQRVALKLMLEEAHTDPQHAERFAREARSAVQLKSIHTARVLDVGKLKNGEPYMVMEYLEGHDLDAVVKARPLSPHIAVDYILQACEAFAEAHALGMIHRDIKLKNLFLTSTVDGRALVKVLDFGLAKKIGMGGDVSLTATSAVFGSPQYMSPEQMRSAKDVDARSDIWSIGVCLYELLTGHVPFDASGVAEICAMVLKDPVPPPSRWVHGIPNDLEAIILRCLEKDANRRYQSVAELAFALEPYAITEGSANRILHVMQTTARSDGNTMVSIDPQHHAAEGARTLAAWGSGEQSPTRRRNVIGVAIGLGAAVPVLLIAIFAFKAIMRPAHIDVSSTMSAASEPMPAETAIPTAVVTPQPAVATPLGAGAGATATTPEPPSATTGAPPATASRWAPAKPTKTSTPPHTPPTPPKPTATTTTPVKPPTLAKPDPAAFP